MVNSTDVVRRAGRRRAIVSSYSLSLLFILPSVIFILYFVFYPILNSIRTSFFEWNGISPHMNFVGLDNYRNVFSDPKFGHSIYNNFVWMLLHILLSCVYGLLLAFAISKSAGRSLFRSVLFLPNVVALSVSGIMWTMIYNTKYGMLVSVLNALGVDTSNLLLLSNPKIAIYAIALAGNWHAYGYYMVLFLAGLQNIDNALYEAAEMDGASSWRQFINITIPGLGSVLTFVVSVAIINGLRGFVSVWVMTEGGPGYSTYLVAVYGYVKAFRELDMGMAMVSALTIGMIIIVITVIYNVIREKRVVS